MQSEPTNTSLRDYIAILKRRKLVIFGVTLIGALAALALSLTQDKVYEAQSSIRVKDPDEQLGVGNIQPTQGDLPAQTAAQGAVTVTSTAALNSVRDQLGVETSVAELRSNVTAIPDKESNFVTITAEADTAAGAAQLANAVASEGVAIATETLQQTYADQASDLKDEIKQTKGLNIAELDPAEIAALTPEERAALADQNTERQTLTRRAADLKLLSLVALFGEVAERATTPSSPASPKPARNAIIGGFLGLVIALIVTGLMESLDRRLRRPDEAKALLDVPIVGVIPEEAMGGVPIVGTPAQEHVAAMDTFRMLRTNMGFLNVDNPPRVVLVTSPLPEEGKTTVAIGLALAGAASGRATLLVEADLHRPVHAQRLGIEPRLGLADYLAGEATPSEVLQTRNFVDPAEAHRNGSKPDTARLICITAGTRTAWSAEMLGSQRFANFLREVRQAYELVVVDTAPLLAVAETSQIAPLADALIFCVRLGRTTVEQAEAGRDALRRLPERPTGLVVAGMSADAGDGYSYYSYAYSYRFGHSEDKRRFGRSRGRSEERV